MKLWAEVAVGRAVVPGGEVAPIIAYRGRAVELTELGYETVIEFLREVEPSQVRPLAVKLTRRDPGLPVEALHLLPPVEGPRKLLFLGFNYKPHAAELRREPPAAPDVFAKTWNSVVGPDDAIILHDPAVKLDVEVELALVLKGPARSLDPSEAWEAIWGYMVANDVTARRDQFETRGVKQWWRAKARDTYAPLGPMIVPRSEVDPSDLKLTLRVNGETWQEGTTRDMIYKPNEVVSFISDATRIETGDVVATGTPPGVGHARGEYLRGGELVEACVEWIGCLENRIVLDEALKRRG